MKLILKPAHPGASIYSLLSPTDHTDWIHAAEIVRKIAKELSPEEEPWCGLVVAGFDFRNPPDDADWFYYDGVQYAHDFSPHEPERPHVFQDDAAHAALVAVASNNLPHHIQYNVYLWLDPDTNLDNTRQLVQNLKRFDILVKH